MHDNKVRLSPDVLEKAERIAAEWGLKNARAAVEAVFRKYCDDYLYGRPGEVAQGSGVPQSVRFSGYGQSVPAYQSASLGHPLPDSLSPPCDALDALDQLLAL